MDINNNLQAMGANRNYQKNFYQQRKAMERISTGLKVNTAGDDPAATSLSNLMTRQIKGFEKAIRNSEDGISLIRTAESGLSEIQNHLARMRELTLQASNGTLTDEERVCIQKEITSLEQGIDNIARYTEFNTINVLAPPTEKTPPTTGTGKADIIFVIDQTGSMGGPIGNVKNNLDAFLQKLKANHIDVRVGIVAYGDVNPSEGGDPIYKSEFTDDADVAKGYIDSIVIDGGGDYSESGLEGIKDGALTYPFRPDATKNFIMITDAPVHDKDDDGKSAYSIDEVVKELVDNNVKLTVVGPTLGPANDQLKSLSDATNGKYLDIKGEFASQLQDLAGSIIEDAGGPEEEGEMRDVLIQKGANANEVLKIKLFDSRAEKLGIKDLSVATPSDAQETLGKIDEAILMVTRQRAVFGAYDNTLETIRGNLADKQINISTANSRLVDADLGEETMKLAIHNVLSNSSQLMLSQAIRVSEKLSSLLENWR